MKLIVLRFVVVALACAGALVVISNLRAPQASTKADDFAALYSALGMPAPVQGPAAEAQEKTVEQVEKNIKVLNGMPASQIVPVMNYFAASMGRRCNFCHVNNNGQWDYAADTKPEKNTAREMVKMVLDVNKTTFKGEPQVGCYTCHRGRNNPQGVPTLPLPLPSPPPGGPGVAAGGGATPGAQPQGSPTPRPTPIPADDIINKYVAAIGGQAAIDKIKTRTMKGTIVGSNGQTLTYESDQSGPDKAYEMFKSGGGTMERAINGSTGWEKNPQGVHELTGGQFTQIKQQSTLFRNLRLREQYTRMRTVGRDKVGDRDAIVIGAATADNQERLYFDAENGLLLRRVTFLRTMVGVIPQQADFLDYRDVDGVKFPFTIVTSSINVGSPISTTKLEEIKLNPALDDAKFKMPAATPPANP
jgi:hypothetical protein